MKICCGRCVSSQPLTRSIRILRTGLWYQVVDKGSDPQNWHETSSSSMYTYMLSRAVQRGYIPKKFQRVASRGYAGVLTQLSKDDRGGAHIANICEGTNVGDLAFYLARPRSTDDLHGLGAFLIMNEQVTHARIGDAITERKL